MDNKKENKPLLKKKEWLEYIDRLITRENVRNNRSGITIWVVIAALAFLIIKIIDFIYTTATIDINVILNLFCFYVVILILFYTIITILKTRSNTKKSFSPSHIDRKRNLFFLCFIGSLFLLLNIVSSKEYKWFYLILNFLALPYILISGPFFIDESTLDKQEILIFRLHILCLQLRLLFYLSLLGICSFLIINNINALIAHPVQKDFLLFSLFTFSFICLLLLLIHLLTGDIELNYLKEIERYIIYNEIDENTITKHFNFYFIGLNILKEINTGFQSLKKALNEFKKENYDFTIIIKNLSVNPDKVDFECINDLYKTIIGLKEKLTHNYVILLNQIAYYIYIKGSKKEIKELRGILCNLIDIQKDQKTIIKQVVKLKKQLVKRPKKVINTSSNNASVN